MLTGVVADAGATGTAAAIPGYTVAGKTGTAQVPDGHGGYSTSDYTATFVGMVPASHPRLVVLVKVDEPRGSIFGGVVAAPAFAAIAKFDLQYLEVPPDAPGTLSRTALGHAVVPTAAGLSMCRHVRTSKRPVGPPVRA